MSITNMIISALLKKGVLYEARNCDLDFDVPILHECVDGEIRKTSVKINIKAEHMTLRITKEDQ